jgi:two-component system response regulator YesN
MLAAFDLDLAKKAAEDFAAATGTGCSVIGPEGERLYAVYPDGAQRSACELATVLFPAGGDGRTGSSCTESHLYGACQSLRFGGQYIHFCPMGLVCWTSPVMADGVLAGALSGGPVNMMDPDEFLAEELVCGADTGDRQREAIGRRIREVPVVLPARVASLSRLLLHTARSLSDESFLAVDEAGRSADIQSRIWERMHSLKIFGGAEDDRSYPFDKEEELLHLIEIGDKSGAQRLLNDLLGSIFFTKGGDMPTLRARIVELTVLLSRAAIRGGADAGRIFGMNFTYLDRIGGFDTADELAGWLSGAMTRFTEQVFRLQDARNADVIFKAVNYIRRQYRRRLTLEETASYVHLSPMYFSRVFKEDAGVNFVAYVNRVRVEAASTLLTSGDLAIADVSAMVGFEGQSYFTKVFRKVKGMTPGAYRKSRGQAPRK